jgi:hypothetical protein
MVAALVGALISSVGMYTIGARASQTASPVEPHALVQTLDAQYAHTPAGQLQPLGFATSSAPARIVRTQPQTVYRTVQQAPARTTAVEREEIPPRRSWKKTALIIGSSTGAGAGVGAIAGGKKGALIGAAIAGHPQYTRRPAANGRGRTPARSARNADARDAAKARSNPGFRCLCETWDFNG